MRVYTAPILSINFMHRLFVFCLFGFVMSSFPTQAIAKLSHNSIEPIQLWFLQSSGIHVHDIIRKENSFASEIVYQLKLCCRKGE